MKDISNLLNSMQSNKCAMQEAQKSLKRAEAALEESMSALKIILRDQISSGQVEDAINLIKQDQDYFMSREIFSHICFNGCIELFDYFVREKPGIFNEYWNVPSEIEDCSPIRLENPFTSAVWGGKLDIIDKITEQQDSISDYKKLYIQHNTMIIAAYTKNAPMVKKLVELGVEVDQLSNLGSSDGSFVEGETALDLAIRIGSLEVTQALIDSGADLHKKRAYIEFAIEKGYSDIAKLLIHQGLPLEDGEKKKFFESAIKKGESKIIKLLIDNGLSLEDLEKKAYIEFAISQNFLEIIQMIVEIDPSILGKTFEDTTFLLSAIDKNLSQISSYLAKASKDLDFEKHHDMLLKAIIAGAKKGNYDVVDLLSAQFPPLLDKHVYAIMLEAENMKMLQHLKNKLTNTHSKWISIFNEEYQENEFHLLKKFLKWTEEYCVVIGKSKYDKFQELFNKYCASSPGSTHEDYIKYLVSDNIAILAFADTITPPLNNPATKILPADILFTIYQFLHNAREDLQPTELDFIGSITKGLETSLGLE